MDRIKVVIVDSGLREELIFKGNPDCVAVSDIENNFVIDSTPASYGHGTAIYSIIRREADNAEIYNIKVKNIENGITDDDLIYVLDYIYDNIPADIINLSLGTCSRDNKRKLFESCKKLTDKGVTIVSAFDNTGMITYPAAFPNVIGVISDERCRTVGDYIYYGSDVVNIGAKGSMQRVEWINPPKIYLSGNSLACAHVTAQVIKFYLSGIKNFSDILSEFRIISKVKCIGYEEKIPENNKIPFNINKAAVYPFNKEMHSLIRFSELLDFEIIDVYDSKYSATVGMSTNKLMKSEECVNHTVRNISEIDWNSFDTLIIGHIQKLSGLASLAVSKDELISEAIKNNKKIYMFDDCGFSGKAPDVFYPRVLSQDVIHLPGGMLYSVNKPVVGVFGTSSSQGKFTLQLELRKRFITSGYKIGQIGTEPQSLLFGMDCCFPVGYNSTVQISGHDVISYINYNMSKMCDLEKEIIIGGGQAGVLNYGESNLQQYNVNFYDFFCGLNPDIVVFCVNPYDPVDFIKRNITFLESVNSCKVLAAVVYPFTAYNGYLGLTSAKRKPTDEEFKTIKENLNMVLEIPIYRLDDKEDLNLLFEDIIKYFAE